MATKTRPEAPAVQPSQPETLPAIRPRSSMAPAAGTPLSQCPTNLDLSTPEGKAMAVAAMSPADIEFNEQGEAFFSATSFIIFPDEVVSRETGELQQVTRTVFFDQSGRTYKTTSYFAPSKVKMLLSLYGPDDWRRGISMVVRERRSRKTGRTYHDLRVIVDRAANIKEG